MTDTPFETDGHPQHDLSPADYTRFPLPLHPENIPAVLKTLPQWLCWKLEHRDGKLTKVPYNAKTGRHGKSNDPATWTGFDKALKASAAYDGIGFAFHKGDGLRGIDLDHCVSEGKLNETAAEIVSRFKGSYIETSPSGTGLRIFCFGKPGRCGKGTELKWIEVYDYTSSRYLTVTGLWWEGTSREVTLQQQALDWLYEQYFKPKEASKSRAKDSGPTLSLGDQGIIEKAKAARNGGKFSLDSQVFIA